MGYYFINSAHEGMIEKILVEKDSYVHEWEPIFIIQTPWKTKEEVKWGVSGNMKHIYVSPGDKVSINTPLAIVSESRSPAGSD
ncbi:biotin/lipoyl-containing protein [Alteribacillus sp. HJP-4]|uniref:biotin/lipoyl-containing protein n=1 Tax=Alteribacillus sp. HJP-4 TaxID=2775394 RepID=UPI0035CD28CD